MGQPLPAGWGGPRQFRIPKDYSMKAVRGALVLWVAMALAMPALAQDRTLARLEHESVPEVTRPRVEARGGSLGKVSPHSEPLSESVLSRSAATAMFVNANLVRARQLAERAWRRDHRDAEALFVQMEAAAMQADHATMLNAALRLCEIGGAAKQDPRIRLAAARVHESAANTPEFRAAIPRVQTLLANSSEDWPELSAALLRAAMDGVPRLDSETLARASGILTEWLIVGPLGRHPLLDFDQMPISPNDDLTQAAYDNRAVENFQFPDGIISLPPYLSPRGTFYAAAHFASLAPGAWTVRFESVGPLEIYVDGKRVLRQEARLRGKHVRGSATVEALAGPHRILAKFSGAATPLRIAVSPLASEVPTPLRAKLSVEELTYDLAAAAYAAGEFGTAIEQINALPSAPGSAALQFLLAQSWTRENLTVPAGLQAWNRVPSLAPGALAADQAIGEQALADGRLVEATKFARRVLAASPNDISALETLGGAIDGDPGLADSEDEARMIWSRRSAEHPSCETFNQAMTFYRSQRQFAEAAAAQQKLDGCAPESLAYAQSLASQGRHGEAARALQQLLAAAPLNRSARLMLVRELQLAGDDSGAARAAAAWLRIAPNASAYRRLAAAGTSNDPTADAKQFYTAYRRDAVQLMQANAARFSGAPVVLVNDHVAILRPDGSVSLYVHTTTRFSSAEDIQRLGGAGLPHGAQVLQLQTLHSDGSTTAMKPEPENPRSSLPVLSPGDAVDEEYVVNYAGDGGIPEHPEAFQFVFGHFDEKVLSARFVVLTPAGQADRGVVIASSDAPRLVARVKDSMLARIWERSEVSVTTAGLVLPNKGLAIVRVVEQENGWTVPSDAEHHRRIETIHPGPRFEESSGTVERGREQASKVTQL
jgi:tetratricopeptide (TPR) repeat protein